MLYSTSIQAQAKAKLATLSLREKIGQMVQFNGRNLRQLLEKMPAKEIAERYPFGSFFTGVDVIDLVGCRIRGSESLEEYKKYTRLPLLISGDLENGAGAEPMPPLLSLAAADDPQLAYDFGRVIAQRGASIGFHWTFAPVTDIILNWLAPAIGVRALGADPEKVAILAEQILRGMQDHGLNATAKHFPGDGLDFRNQHIGVAVDEMTKRQWDETFGLVYRRVIRAGVRAIMAGHIALPCVDSRRFPAVLSEKISTDLLRRELGFEGVLVSDALIMAGFVSFRSYEKRMIAQINAGIDVMLWPEPDIFDLVEKAVKAGDIPESRIDESAQRVLEMKYASGVLGSPRAPVADAQDYEVVSAKIAERGTVLVQDPKHKLPLNPRTARNIMVYIADYPEKAIPNPDDPRYSIILKGLEEHGAKVTLKSNGNCLDLLDFELKGGKYDEVIFLFTVVPTYRTRISGPAQEAIWMMSNTVRHDPIAISLFSPYLSSENPVGTFTILNGFCHCPATQRAIVKQLYGEIPITGKSPVPMDVDHTAQDAWREIRYKCLE